MTYVGGQWKYQQVLAYRLWRISTRHIDDWMCESIQHPPPPQYDNDKRIKL